MGVINNLNLYPFSPSGGVTSGVTARVTGVTTLTAIVTAWTMVTTETLQSVITCLINKLHKISSMQHQHPTLWILDNQKEAIDLLLLLGQWTHQKIVMTMMQDSRQG